MRAPDCAGVTVVCDFLRPDGRGRPGGVDRSASWLHSAIRRQVAAACGSEPALLSPTNNPALSAWVEGMRPPADADPLWALSYERLPPAWEAAIAPFVLAPLRGCFCIGYEMPPYLTDLLDRNAIPYLDIRLHPVRFLDDLLFGARASDPDTQAHLIDLAVPESLVHMTAGLREATCRHISEPRIPAGTLLVVGQKRYDSSQILDGAFFDAARHRDRIAAIGAEYAAIVLKPHPQDDTHTLLEVAASVCPNVLGVTRDNIYRMLAMPEVTGILTVSSSTAYEAPYFGKNVATLAPPRLRFAWRGDAPDPGAHVSLDDLLLSVDFWRGALAPYMRTTPVDGVRFPPKPNRLRIAFDSWWNFNEIDTDRLPARSGEVAKAQR